jgi:hypothetical protein
MGVANNADVVALELERVIPKIRELYEMDDMFYANIKRRDVEKISNRQMRVPLEMASGGNFGYFDSDGGDLGRGGAPTWDKATLTCVFMKEGIEYTKLAEWGTDDSRKAITQAVRRLVARSTLEIRRQIDAQMMQAGNGVIGVITTPTVPSTGTDQYVCTTDGFGVRLIRSGQTLQVFDTTLATLRGTTVVTYYDVDNNTIQCQPSVAGVVAGDKLVTSGLSAPTALPALFGVPYHDSNASTGTWLGFDRSTTPQIRASGVNAASAALSLPLPRLAINKIGNRVGINNKFSPRAWMHPAQQQAYEEIGQLVIQIHKQAKDEALDMYFGGQMQMAGATVKPHFNWDKTRIDMISDEVWGRAEILPIDFYRVDGRKIFELRGASGGVMTADIFYQVVGMQTFVNNPAACSYIYSLAVPSGY